MSKSRWFASALQVAAFGAALVMPLPGAPHADEITPVLPKVGSHVVIYTHTFQPQHFAEGAELIANGFAEAIEDLGQQRTNVIMEHPSTYEVVNVSFFEDDTAVDAWHSHDARLDVLEKLEPLMSAPIDIKVLKTIAIFQSADGD